MIQSRSGSPGFTRHPERSAGSDEILRPMESVLRMTGGVAGDKRRPYGDVGERPVPPREQGTWIRRGAAESLARARTTRRDVVRGFSLVRKCERHDPEGRTTETGSKMGSLK